MQSVSLIKITNGLKSFIGQLFKQQNSSSLEEDSIADLPKSTNPWQDELDRLLVNGIQNPDRKILGDLASSLEPIDPFTEEKISKPKRPSDATVKDLKAWWSESIATWEPGIGKTLNSRGQKPRNNNSAHWFQ